MTIFSRSERKKKSEIEKDKMEGIEARLLATEDSDLDLEVREIPYKGRGVVVSPPFSQTYRVGIEKVHYKKRKALKKNFNNYKMIK